jgi:hypothetical protein
VSESAVLLLCEWPGKEAARVQLTNHEPGERTTSPMDLSPSRSWLGLQLQLPVVLYYCMYIAFPRLVTDRLLFPADNTCIYACGMHHHHNPVTSPCTCSCCISFTDLVGSYIRDALHNHNWVCQTLRSMFSLSSIWSNTSPFGSSLRCPAPPRLGGHRKSISSHVPQTAPD